MKHQDVLNNYQYETLQLSPDYEGDVTATLIYHKQNTGNRPSVLYIHGYVDYFFQAHLGDWLSQKKYDFYALDLRKYGRSILPHQHPNYCKSIKEYHEEITIAIKKILELSNDKLVLMGHSTGGLIVCDYMIDGACKNNVSGLILNSPFFDFYEPNFKKAVMSKIAKPVANIFPYANIGKGLSSVYPKSIYKDYFGDWEFNLNWKPINGFKTYFAWLSAIVEAQNRLKTANIQLPMLVMHAKSSKKVNTYSEDAKKHDIVLNVEDIKRIGSKLGDVVSFAEIQNGIHDLFLSQKQPREKAFYAMDNWLNNL